MQIRQRPGKLITLALGLALVLAACGNSSSTGTTSSSTAPARTPTVTASVPPASFQPSVQPNVAYGPLPAETLGLCTPTGATGALPGVILIHGGGWVGGDKSAYAATCRFLAARGFVAATIDYRLAPANIWPAQLIDAQLAVRWLRAHAAQIHLDPHRLCSWGSSAGGHLAIFLGVLSTIHAGDEAGLYANESPHATCVVDDFGPTNLTITDPTPAMIQVFHSLFGGATLQSDPAIYHDASPIFDVSSQSAPTLIIHGTNDMTVPFSQSQALQSALQNAGVSVMLIPYTGGHGFSGITASQRTALMVDSFQFVSQQEHEARS
jgi:acetyl esterase/lipase